MTKNLIAILFASMFALLSVDQAYAAVKVKKNGSVNKNKVTVENKKVNVTKQANLSAVVVLAGTNANSGDVDVKNNVGGSSSVKTGESVAKTNVTVTGSVNKVTGDDCGCVPPQQDITISKNGSVSDNDVKVENTIVDVTEQLNVSLVGVGVLTNAQSGDVDVEQNVNSGSSVTTGPSSAVTNVTVEQPANVLK